ncbi:hypothetical protein NMY22_g18142 [Coprinellus aureogranulatus]|nr:hypothetical protein NMY22_g18142 [Coprinellus aureogranulatus]
MTAPIHPDDPTPRYPDVPPLSCVVYRRGRAAFNLNPYSAQHAFLTGHIGSPTPGSRGTVGDPRREDRARGHCVHNSAGFRRDHGENTRAMPGRTLRVLLAHVLPSQGDVPERVPMRNIQAKASEDIQGGRVSMPAAGNGIAHGPLQNETLRGQSIVQSSSSMLEGSQDCVTAPVSGSQCVSSDRLEGRVNLVNKELASGGYDEDHSIAATEREAHGGFEEPQTLFTLPHQVRPLVDAPALEVQYIAEPIEHNHRRFAPYNLRMKDRRSLRQQIGEQIRAIGMPFDDFILRQAGVKRFNPAVPAPTHIDLLYDCASATGRGISIPQFGRIFKRCADCDNFVLANRNNHSHRCDGPPADVKASNFQITEYLFDERCRGLTYADLQELLIVCDTCLRVHLIQHAFWHKCPTDNDIDFVDGD